MALQEQAGSVKKPALFPRRTLYVALALLAADLGGAYLLDALGLIEGLLSPSGDRLALLLPLGVAFYGARLLLYFVAPGLVLGALCLWAADRRAARAPRDRGAPESGEGRH